MSLQECDVNCTLIIYFPYAVIIWRLAQEGMAVLAIRLRMLQKGNNSKM